MYKKTYRPVKNELRKWGCNRFVFDDIYHEAFSIFLDNQQAGNKQIHDPETYLRQLCRNLWFKELKRRSAFVFIEEFGDENLAVFEGSIENKEDEGNFALVLKHLESLPPNCKEVLVLFALNYSNKTIKAILYLKSLREVENRKYYCKEKLRKSIINDPLFEK